MSDPDGDARPKDAGRQYVGTEWARFLSIRPQCLSYCEHSHSYTLLIPVVGIVRAPSTWARFLPPVRPTPISAGPPPLTAFLTFISRQR